MAFGGRFASGCFAIAALGLVLSPVQARADDDDDGPSILDSVKAFSAIRDARDALADRGFKFSGFYFSDPRSNLHGGIRKGTTYSGLLDLTLDVDAEKAFGLEGGKLHANVFQIHGKDVSDEKVGNVLSSDDIGAEPTTRLFELWYDQRLTDKLSVRFGQMAADEEFLISDYGSFFIDATFGWAGPPSENLPQGGPAYPLAAPAFQVQYAPTDSLTLVAAIYNGTPANPHSDEPEKNNRHGLNFRVGDPPLVIVEGRYKYNQGEDADGLPGSVKLGAYASFAKFDDLKRGDDGLVLGAPGSSGVPRSHRGDVNFYGVIDQQIYRAPGGDDDKGIGVFGRVIAGGSDRNEINLYLDGGFVASGLVPGRPADKFGVAIAYANFSPALADADRAANAASGGSAPIHDYEAVIEANYRAQIIPGLTIQPELQYVWHPGGGAADPRRTYRRIPNATIFGLTTIVKF